MFLLGNYRLVLRHQGPLLLLFLTPCMSVYKKMSFQVLELPSMENYQWAQKLKNLKTRNLEKIILRSLQYN